MGNDEFDFKEIEKESHISDFCSKYGNDYIKKETMEKGTYIIYGSIQGALVFRLNGVEAGEKSSGKFVFVRLSNMNFDQNIGPKLGNGFNAVNCTRSPGANCGFLRFYPEREYVKNDLTFDGICAYLALATKEQIYENRENIISDIERNAKQEMLNVQATDFDGDAKINEIKDRYIQLSCVAGKLFDIAENHVEENEVRMDEYKDMIENNVACTAQAYGEAIEELNKFLPEIDDKELDPQ